MIEHSKISLQHLLSENSSYLQKANPSSPRGMYDFAIAYPDPDTIPVSDLVECLDNALSEEGRDLATYPHPQGYPPLRELLSQKLKLERGISVEADDIILADGSSQPIHMAIESLIDPGDVVITEDFVYSGTLTTLRRFRADVRGVPCDDSGMTPDGLEREILASIAKNGIPPKMVYTIPTFQNPQGWTMSLGRRKSLLTLCQRYSIPILEDDCYVDLRFDGKTAPSIHSLDESGIVIYVGSFSKIIAPGMRMGYMTGPHEILEAVKSIKSGGGVNQFAALAIHRYATSKLTEHIRDINRVLRVKRDAMLTALGETFGSYASWSRPQGALYIWLKMPSGADLTSTHESALKAGVGYIAGVNFSPNQTSGKNYARLCYGYNTPDEIHDGISHLADVFDKAGYFSSD